MTKTRSLTHMTSGNSDDTTKSAFPARSEFFDDAVDVLFGTDVDPASGFVENQDVHLGVKPAGNDCLLLVPSTNNRIWRSTSGGRIRMRSVSFFYSARSEE